MAIYLDEQTAPYLERLLKKASPKDFIAKRLLEMVLSDNDRKQNIKTCKHTYQSQYGYHERCPHCWGLKNGYEYWGPDRLSKKDYQSIGSIEGGEQTTHQSKDIGNAAPSTPTQPDELPLL